MKRQIEKMTPLLKAGLILWDRFDGKNCEGYESLKKYVFHFGVAQYLDEMENIDYDAIARLYGKEYAEKLKSVESGSYVYSEGMSPVGYIKYRLDQKEGEPPNLYIQAVATHPLHQNEGIATDFISGLLKNYDRYFSVKPFYLSGLVDSSNYRSLMVFSKFGQATVYEHTCNYNVVMTEIDYDRIENGRIL